VARLHLQALGSLFVASYDSQGSGGGIRPDFEWRMFIYVLKKQGMIVTDNVRSGWPLTRIYVEVMEQIDQCIWDNRKISIGETSSETGM
jgi:hypothetical protein